MQLIKAILSYLLADLVKKSILNAINNISALVLILINAVFLHRIKIQVHLVAWSMEEHVTSDCVSYRQVGEFQPKRAERRVASMQRD